MNEYDVGDTIAVDFTLGVQPDSLTICTKSPSKVETIYTYGTDSEVSNPTGYKYRLTHKVTSAGIWRYLCEAIDADGNTGTDETEVRVLDAKVTRVLTA